MPVPWTPSFGTYHAWYEDQTLTFFTVDTEADVAQRASHSYLCAVRLDVLEPDDRGMPSPAEGPAIDRISDRITFQLERDWDAWQVGRETKTGQVTFVYYLGNKPLLEAQRAGSDQQIIDTTDPHWAPYKIIVNVTQDPEWLFYRNAMSPTEIELHLISSYRFIQQLAWQGDDPSIEREIQHVSVFADEEHARLASEALDAAGYVTSPTSEGEQNMVILPFKSRSDLTGFGIEKTLVDLLPYLDEQDGYYAGWTCNPAKEAEGVALKGSTP